MDFDEKIQNLSAQLNAANREVIIQDRILGQTRERVAELQGRINMLVELQQEEKVALAGKNNQPVPGIRKPGPKPEPKKKIDHRKYPNHVREKHSGKKLFPDKIDKFIEKNWEKNTDVKLRVLIGEKFDKYYTVDQLKGHRRQINCISDSPGRKKEKGIIKKPGKLNDEDIFDDESIDGMDLD